MKKTTTLVSLAFLALTQAYSVSAASLPGSDIIDVETYLSDATYFNGYTEITGNTAFSGQWQYTAIAYESSNENNVSLTSGATFNPGSAEFSTFTDSNFGEWASINFNTEQLYFQDSDGPLNVALNPFTTASPSFRIFQLNADSNPLAYLGSNITLAAGTIIVGFNDNGEGNLDVDFDDIIVALRPVSEVPIPAAAFLFAPALLGFMGLRRKTKVSVA